MDDFSVSSGNQQNTQGKQSFTQTSATSNSSKYNLNGSTQREQGMMSSPTFLPHNVGMMASLSSTLQNSWPSDNNIKVDRGASETKLPVPILSNLLRSASLAGANARLEDPADKILVKELVINEDPNIPGLLQSVGTDGGQSLRAYIRRIKERQGAQKKHDATSAAKATTSSQDVEKERERLEKSMRKAMRKAARVQKKLERLGAATTTPPQVPMALPSSFETPAPTSQTPVSLPMNDQSTPPLGMMGTSSPPSGNLLGSQSPVNTSMRLPQLNQDDNPQFFNQLNPNLLAPKEDISMLQQAKNLQAQMNLAALSSSLNQGSPGVSPFGFYPPDFSQLQQNAQLNSMIAAQLNLGKLNQPGVNPGVNSLLPTNTYLPSALGSSSKRDRPQSMNKLVSFREPHRSRNVLAPSPLGMDVSSISALSNLGTNGKPKQFHDARPDIAINTRVYNKSKDHVSATPRRWTKEEDELLRTAVRKHKEKNWKAISNDVPGRNHVQCLQRWRKALDPRVVKGHWTTAEDNRLMVLVAENPKNWGHVARGIPGRTAKQCRERYHNHLDPSIKKGDWTAAEDSIIIEQQDRLGNKWAEISKFLPGRTENSVKIRWKSIQRQAQGGYNSRRARKPGPRFLPEAVALP